MAVSIKRVREPREEGDGLRVLVDRLWPRGVSKQDAAVDLWLPKAAPSHSLRRWFGHDPERWAGFVDRYYDEIEAAADVLPELVALADRARHRPVTLLYDAREPRFNNAVALRALLWAMGQEPR